MSTATKTSPTSALEFLRSVKLFSLLDEVELLELKKVLHE
jgi:hypothetical protein